MNININGIISSRFQHVKVAGDFKGPVSPIVRLEGWIGMVWKDYPLVSCYIAIEHGHRNSGFSH